MLMVDNDLDTRMRLRHALLLNPDFGRDIQSNNFNEALELLKQEQESLDLVFISNSNLEFPDIEQFIHEARAASAAQDAAFVVVFSSYEGKDEMIAKVYEIGADSYIFEPYSADDFRRMANVAARVGPRRVIDREVLSIGPLVREMVKLIDLMHRLFIMHCSVDKTWERLRTIGTRLAGFQPESHEVYFEYIEECLPLHPAPGHELEELKKNQPKSVRLQKRLEEALLNAPDKQAQREAELKRKLPPVRCN
jgi:response regulator RpfG family c-di-GMP phosphodiesterase